MRESGVAYLMRRALWELTPLVVSEMIKKSWETKRMLPKKHYLKIAPEYFNAVTSYQKTFEIRLDDRDFSVGDQVYLREWVDGHYTWRFAEVVIKYVTNFEQKKDYVVFGFELKSMSLTGFEE